VTDAAALCTNRVVTGTVEERLADLAARMKAGSTHYCLVLDESRRKFAGLIQLSDLVGVAFPANRILGDLIGGIQPVFVRPEESASHIAALFERHTLNEVVVIDDEGLCRGLITAQSVLQWTVGELRRGDGFSHEEDGGAKDTQPEDRAPGGRLAGEGADLSRKVNPPGETRELSRAAAQPNYRILLVEDHEATRVVLLAILRRRGHRVGSAHSVATALQLASESEFDLVITDVGLPDGDGYGLMARLNASYGLRGIAMTGAGSKADFILRDRRGVEAYLLKPLAASDLDREILRYSWAKDAVADKPL
jgi:CheY-like chemotaxis protein